MPKPSREAREARRRAEDRLATGYGWPRPPVSRFLGLSLRGWTILGIVAGDVLLIAGVAAVLGWIP